MKLVSAVLNLLQILRCNISRHGRAHPLARCYKSEIGRYVLLGRHSSLVYGSIGDYSYIGSNSNLNHARIGKYTSIAQNVRIAGGTHPTGQFVSTHPLTYAARPYCGRQYVQVSTYDDMGWLDPERQIAVDIGNDVWIGADVLIIPGTAGIRIGDGAIIGGGCCRHPGYTAVRHCGGGARPRKEVSLYRSADRTAGGVALVGQAG